MPSVPGNHKPKASVRTRAVAAAQHAERRAEMWRMRLAGRTQLEIAEHFGISQQAVSIQLRKALAERPATAIDEYRAVELDKLDRLEQVALGVLGNTHYVVSGGAVVYHTQDGEIAPLVDDAPKLAAIKAILQICAQRAALLGLNAPAKVAIEGRQVHYVIDGVDMSALR